MSGFTLVIIVLLIMFVAVVIVLTQDEEPDEVADASIPADDGRDEVITDEALNEIFLDDPTGDEEHLDQVDDEEPAAVESISPDDQAPASDAFDLPIDEIEASLPAESEPDTVVERDAEDVLETEPARLRSDG